MARSSGSSVCSASGEEIAGACLIDVVVDASLACRIGKRPLLLTVTCFGLANVELALLFTDGFGERPLPCPGIITCNILTLPSSSGVTELWVESGASDELLDLTETMRAAPCGRAAVEAGIG